jgi:two-component system, chemotaxis family, response regulator Rcp1
VKQTILLVDDNDADVDLLRRFLSTGPDSPRLVVARDGEEALQILRHNPPFVGSPHPDLVVLDLDMPRKSGKQVLAEIRQDPDLQLLPVLIFTTCDSPQEISSAYKLNANCCLTKPADLDEYGRIVRSIEDFWLKVAKLPSSTSPIKESRFAGEARP